MNKIILFISIVINTFCFSESNSPTIIFLNGTSSAGKTSIVKSLQEHLKEPYLHMGIDHFLSMLPQDYIGTSSNAEKGLHLKTNHDSKPPVTTVTLGPVGLRLISGMQQSTRVMAEKKFNIILDEVLFNREEFIGYLNLLKDYKVYFIAIKPPVEIAEKREKERGDRLIGLARGLYEVYSNYKYDFDLDSSLGTPDECALKIIRYMESHPTPTAFQSNEEG